MRRMWFALVVAGIFAGSVWAEEELKNAPNVILKSPDGKKTYDLSKLAAEGPVLVRLTCACSGFRTSRLRKSKPSSVPKPPATNRMRE